MKSKYQQVILAVSMLLFVLSACNSKENKKPEQDAATMMKAATLENCVVCNMDDNHHISLDSVLDLIVAFDNIFVRRGIVKNSGGILDFDSLEFNGGIDNDTSYSTFKLHWAYETNEDINRLSVTCELSVKNCVNNIYQGDAGVEGPSLNTSDIENDFKLKKSPSDTLRKIDVLRHFGSAKCSLNKPGSVLINSRNADSLLTIFKNSDSQLSGSYEGCDDIVYKKKASYDEIIAATNMKAVRYYFGYDSRANINYKLRIILVGIDSAGELVIFDASDNLLMREYSRPRP
jgi:hypothetical protein